MQRTGAILAVSCPRRKEDEVRKLIASLALLVLASFAPAPARTSMTCELTGATVESCCCVEKDGAMVCTLTGETVSSCCCR
jgi:hypothetical protein